MFPFGRDKFLDQFMHDFGSSPLFFWMQVNLLEIKLMRFEALNRIVDDSDSKAIYIDPRFRSDSISNDLIESTIAILI